MPEIPDLSFSWKYIVKYSYTILRTIYIVLFVSSWIVLFRIESGITSNEQSKFSCRWATESEERNCSAKYSRGPYFVQRWLYNISFYILFGIIKLGFILRWIKSKGYKTERCTLHVHQLYFGTLLLQILAHLVMCGLLLANLDMYVEEIYYCMIENATFTCIDGTAKLKTVMNMVFFGSTCFFIAFIFFELFYYGSKWIVKKEERERQEVGPNICKTCHFFFQSFSPLPDESQGSETQALNSGVDGPGRSVNFATPAPPANKVPSDERDSAVEDIRSEESAATPSEAWKGSQSFNIPLVGPATIKKMKNNGIQNQGDLLRKYHVLRNEAEFKSCLEGELDIKGTKADSICIWALATILRKRIAEDPDTPLTHDRHFTSNSLDNAIPGIERITVEKLSGIGITDVRTLMKEFLDVYKGNEVDFRCWLEEKKITEVKRDAICNFLLAEIQRQREKQGNPVRKNLDEELKLASSSNAREPKPNQQEAKAPQSRKPLLPDSRKPITSEVDKSPVPDLIKQAVPETKKPALPDLKKPALPGDKKPEGFKKPPPPTSKLRSVPPRPNEKPLLDNNDGGDSDNSKLNITGPISRVPSIGKKPVPPPQSNGLSIARSGSIKKPPPAPHTESKPDVKPVHKALPGKPQPLQSSTSIENEEHGIEWDKPSTTQVLPSMNKSRVKGPSKALPGKYSQVKDQTPEEPELPPWKNEIAQKEKLKTHDKKPPQLQVTKNTEQPKSVLAESADAIIIEDLKIQLKSAHAQMEDMEKRLMKHIGVLTNDLYEERKQRANMAIEVDRLKKKVAILESH